MSTPLSRVLPIRGPGPGVDDVQPGPMFGSVNLRAQKWSEDQLRWTN